jgi:hypothetical protein
MYNSKLIYNPKLIYKSKSFISFYEYKKKITEIIKYDNDWGHYIDIENEPYKINYIKNYLKNDDITNDNITNDNITNDNITNDNITNDNITNDCVNILYKYSFIVTLSCVSLIILILF